MTEQFSIQISRALNDLGYDEETRQYRIARYEEVNSARSFCAHRLASQDLLSGSKAEGTSRFDESDFDYLYIYSNVEATECEDLVPGENALVLFMEEDSAPPGYCKLRLLQGCRDNVWHQELLRYSCYIKCPGQGKTYLSSSAVLDMDLKKLPVYCEKSGPAIQATLPGNRDMDNVQAIRCVHMPQSLKCWIRRHLDHVWPTRQLLKEIAGSDIFLVPTGMHGTEQRDLQWRISFNIPEKMLIQKFTSVQYKIYVLVKMIKSEILQPHCPESVTSYIVKSLMLWAVEQIPEQLWSEGKLVDLLFSVLYKLYKCIQCRYCPMYFIPECNILHDRVTKTTQRIICDLLSSFLSDKSSCKLRLPSISAKLDQYIFVPMAFRRFNGQFGEKTNIVLNIAEEVYAQSLQNTNRATLLCCLQGAETIPYEDLLADLVSIQTPSGSEKRNLAKYLFNQTFSNLALQNFVDASSSISNIQQYRGVQRCVKILNENCSVDVLCGRARFAQVLYTIGKYKEALHVLANSADRVKYHMHKCTYRRTMQQKYVIERDFLDVYETGCISTSRVLKKFFLPDLRYDHQMELCLPKALQYEVYMPFLGGRGRVHIDPQIMLHLLQYLCYKNIGQRIHADVALKNLEWCSSRHESNIGYREVALNVLGHCFMEEGVYDKALRVLAKSLKLLKEYVIQHPHRTARENYGLKLDVVRLRIAVLLNRVYRNLN